MYQLFQNKPFNRGNLLLSKDYWMKDNSVKECFSCGKPFTTFRRRHHCRLCGQIFCNDCTTLISGERFTYNGQIRLCHSCLSYDYDDSSDEYDDIDDNNNTNNDNDDQKRNEASMANGTDISSNIIVDGDVSSLQDKSERDPSIMVDLSDKYSSSSEDESSMTLYTALHSDSIGNLSSYSDSMRGGESNLRPSRSSYSINQVGAGYDKTQASLIRMKSRKRSKSTKRNIDDNNNNNIPSRMGQLLTAAKKDGDAEVYSSAINTEPLAVDNDSIICEKEYMHKELNDISIHHIKRFLKQTLVSFDVRNKKSWYYTIHRLLNSIELIDPDPKNGDSLDITRYVKVKKILGATPAESECINGIVFTKNVALKSMRSQITNPNVVLIMFPLNYEKGTQAFVSLDQVMAQEKEYLDKLVKRIVSLRPKPDVVISGSTISGYALELLDIAGISVAYSVKPQIIERLSRMLEADVVGSMEKLATKPRLGSCELFEVKSFVHQNVRKTFMFFTGCKSTLGCTFILRGQDQMSLNKVKNILEFLVYMMFHLKLETFLFRNEYLLMPNARELKEMLHHTPYFGFDYQFIERFDQRLFSISPTIKVPLPHLLTKARDCEKHLNNFLENYDMNAIDADSAKEIVRIFGIKLEEYDLFDQGSIINLAQVIIYKKSKLLKSTCKLYSRQWESFSEQISSLLEVSFHQSISFLYSTTNAKNQSPCIFPKIIQIEYYMDFTDAPLGHYIENLVQTSNHFCQEGCGSKLLDHYKNYVHGDGAITVSIENMECKIPGLQHVILMWSTCQKCNHSTPVIPMNEIAWKFSFGKFLELGFLSVPLTVSFIECQHDLKDRIKYFGLNDLTVKFSYQKIDLLEVIVPGDKVYWRPEVDVTLKLEVYQSIVDRANNFFEGVLDRLEGVKIDNSSQENADAANEKVKQLIGLAKENHAEIMNQVKKIYTESSPLEYLPLNIILKGLQSMSVSWDLEFSQFEEEFLPSENDITRITAFQLKNFFKEKKSPEDLDTERGKNKEKLKGLGYPESEYYDEKSKTDLERSEADPAVNGSKKWENDNDYDMKQPENIDERETSRDIQLGTMPSTDNSNSVDRDTSLIMEDEQQLKSSTSRSSFKHSNVLEKVSRMEARLNNNSDIKSENFNDSHLLSGKTPLLSTGNLLKTELINRSNFSDDFATSTASSKKLANTRVAKLKDYYDQMHVRLNKEFVLERENERKKIAKRYHAIPLMSSKPIVEVYQDFEDAVQDENEDKSNKNHVKNKDHIESSKLKRDESEYNDAGDNEEASVDVINGNPVIFDNHGDSKELESTKNNEAEAPEIFNDNEQIGEDKIEHADINDNKALSLKEKRTEDKNEIPQQEKNSLLSAIKKFWADRSVLWKPLDYPLKETEHVFVDSDVIIREDEPSSLIAFSLSSKNYLQTVKRLRKEVIDSLSLPGMQENIEIQPGSKIQEKLLEAEMLKKRAIHLKFQIMDDSAILSCKVFFVGQFEALREACGSNFIQSLSRCIKWDSSGGKSGSAFLKTLDDRLIIKQLSEPEFESFVKMAPSYFEFVSQSLFHDLPSVISKIFGFYQLVIKNSSSGKNIKMNVIIMENLFYNRKNLRIFDLKGSMRNRHVEKTGKENEVLLDENMVDYIYESPLFVRIHSKKLLRASLWNDTLFLSKMNVMDYSLVIGIDTEKNEIVAGIIDYIRTFTWDKKLESWVKEKGLVGGGGKRPTVVTPKQYKSRFRAAMERYILLVPDKFYSTDQLR
ncbi:1-phosphatidylinositol-3-phosphate 5-kinase [Saccharomycopsis crataegensis]|uniref:1-phosphatidylinositol-3-phosphate 5-kinase n=1 Tax=Saccharomycopsis crataegensis TaxID=43959 RepID=A0AAV5QKC2_9ASCO|nr:1-phosphatidylinositol-3-phosphate 5-kinase [Saccharomycopsis crataegensis]